MSGRHERRADQADRAVDLRLRRRWRRPRRTIGRRCGRSRTRRAEHCYRRAGTRGRGTTGPSGYTWRGGAGLRGRGGAGARRWWWGGGRGQAPGAPDGAYAIGLDGYVRALNIQSGWDLFPPVQFLPANTRPAGPIVVNDESSGFLYAVTTNGCAYTPDSVWAVDLLSQNKAVVSWQAEGATIAGSGGPAFGRDGAIYVATTGGSSPLSSSVVKLEAKTLRKKANFTLPKADFVSSPIVIQHKDKELVVTAAQDGRIFVRDAATLSEAVATTPADAGLSRDGLASWQDDAGVRWVLATGPSSIVAYRLIEQGTTVTLQKGWTSRALVAPLTPLIVNGVVFALASGDAEASGAGQRTARSSAAVLYALDGATGKELWNSGKAITAPARGGLAAGAGVVYVPAIDSTLYAFGFPIEK